MPAIQLARLKKQIDVLRFSWLDIQEFQRELNNLLDFYADHSYRMGQSAEPITLLDSYHVPAPLIREIVNGLSDLLVKEEEYTIRVCHRLWEQEIYETKLLAIHFLGFVRKSEQKVADIAGLWMATTTDQQLINAMFNYGVAEFAARNPDAYLDMVRLWLEKPETVEQSIGLNALETLIRIPDFNNFPPCYKLVTPFVRQADPQLRPELVRVLVALAERSPTETTYFYMSIMEAKISTQTGILIRQSIHTLPHENYEKVWERLRERRRDTR